MRLAFIAFFAAATAAVAQAPSPPEPEAKTGLGDLQQTVQGLSDQPPAEPASPPAAEPPASQPPRAPAPPQPAIGAPPLIQSEIADLNRVAARGRQLIAITRAGIVATQDMLARVADPERGRIDGWLAEAEGGSMTVTFYDNTDDGPKAVYRVTIQAGRVTSRDTFLLVARPPLSARLTRLAAARTAVEALNHSACSPQGFNFLVVPPDTGGGPILVYEVTAPSQRGRFPMGGHFRTSVTDRQPGEGHAFATGCADIIVTDPPAGQLPPAIPIATPPDPWPTEIHVLISQMSGRALTFSAGTPARQWIVAGARIAEIRNGAPRWVTAQD